MKPTASSSSADSSSSSFSAAVVASPSSSGGLSDEPPTTSDPSSSSISVERRTAHSAVCRWTLPSFSRIRARAVWSRYFDIGGFDCRLLLYPKGDSQALPGYSSLYLQLLDPSSSSSRFDCFASYRLSLLHPSDPAKSLSRDSWHRFSAKKKSHGWCDFAPSASLSSFLLNDSVTVSADILILNESLESDPSSGKFIWKVHNFPLFRDMIRTQKIMSPIFPAGDCNLRISIYQSSVSATEHLSMCLESKDADKLFDRTCWCLFRMSVLNQRPGGAHVHRDSYGRFAADKKGGDNTSLGWNDYMKMADFVDPEAGYLLDDTAVFSTSFHVIRESSSLVKNAALAASVARGGAARKADGHFGKFMWRIENFTRLKDLLKKRKITGLCVKSKRFQIGNRDCRLIVYPRGQSQPPCHLSVFLEVTDSRNTTNDWSCFVSHRLSVVNQKMEEKSVTKESQNRYSKAAKDWGWREFVTLTSLFDQDSGFLVHDTVYFSAEVLILKETSILQELGDQDSELCPSGSGSQIDAICKRGSFTWRVENFLSFKEIMETRKIFSKFFQAGGCELRIGVYESFDMICIYLESDQSAGSDPEKNYWVRYKMAVVNQKNPAKTVWKESSICTKTWNNSVLQFMKVSDMLEADAGFLVRDTVVFICEIMDCCPWFEFSDLEVLVSEDDQDALSTDPDEIIDSEYSDGISGDEGDIFRNLLSQAGFHLTYGDNPSNPQLTLREKLLMDAGAIAGFLAGLRIYIDHPAKLKRLLLPTKLSLNNGGNKDAAKGDSSSPSLMNLLMGVKVLQQALVDLLLDVMIDCCQPSELRNGYESSDASLKASPDSNGSSTPSERSKDGEVADQEQFNVNHRLESGGDESVHSYAVQSSDVNVDVTPEKSTSGQLIFPPETSGAGLPVDDGYIRSPKTRWGEQSEELLGLIINSLKALDSAVPKGCSEPIIRPQSVEKIALVLDKAPSRLHPDLIALVPKLVDHTEHSLAACALLDRLQKSDAGPSLHLPVLGALSQLEIGKDVWEHILLQASELLSGSNDELLAAVISFIFRAASQCGHLPEAVAAIRSRLKSLGAEVPQCVLDVLTNTVHNWKDVAEALLREIDSDCGANEICTTSSCSAFTYGVDELSAGGMIVEQDIVVDGCHHLSDVYILIDMLSISSLFVEVSQVLERAILRGAIGLRFIAMVLERRHSQKLNVRSHSVVDDSPNKQALMDEPTKPFCIQDDDFTSILSLGEVMSFSSDIRVQDFVRMLYAIMFKIYSEEPYRVRMLKGLVDRAINTSDNSRIVDIDMDVLVFLVRDEEGIARPVLNMIREIAVLAQVDRATLWHQLCAAENELVRSQEERQVDLSNFARQKDALTQRLNESEASTSRLKSELKLEMDRAVRVKKEHSEQIANIENQLEWIRSEKDEQIAKLSADWKVLQDRLHDAEAQLFQLKSRKRDELKRMTKEKNALAEKLKNAEAARKRYDEETKRYATETVNREEVRQSLEDEVRRLTKTVGETEGEKREKEEQVARCEVYIDEMETRLRTCQQYIQNLEITLREEMARHAPLYGAGLESLSSKELETISHIHEEGLRQIRSIQQSRGIMLSQVHGVFTTMQMPVALPPMNSSSLGSQGSNGNMGEAAAVGTWFSSS